MGARRFGLARSWRKDADARVLQAVVLSSLAPKARNQGLSARIALNARPAGELGLGSADSDVSGWVSVRRVEDITEVLCGAPGLGRAQCRT
jgi:hypothetical protein